MHDRTDSTGRSALHGYDGGVHAGVMGITSAARNRLQAEVESTIARTELGSHSVTVSIRRGVVTLTGHTDSDATRRAVVDSVASTPGVRHVLDSIQLTGDQPTLEAAG